MKRLLYILLLLAPLLGFGQKIYQTSIKSEAKYIIYVTTNEYEADWIIQLTEYENLAGNGAWWFTPYQHYASFSIYITDKKYEADKVVFYTRYKSKIKYK